jgi:membrane associated rhomboid family serine protease
VFIPLHDSKNGLRHLPFQYVTVSLIALNVIIYAVFLSGVLLPGAQATFMGYGMIPAVVNDVRELDPQLVAVPELWTLVTYQFLHGGWMHLASNMLFLWVFGDNVEDALGHMRFLIFYVLCGVAGGLLHLFFWPESEAPLVGASGAVAGVIGAYLVLHPRVQLWVLALGRIPLRIPAWIALAGWIGFQVFNLIVTTDDAVAWWAHVGGVIAGVVLVVFMRRRGVALFDSDMR